MSHADRIAALTADVKAITAAGSPLPDIKRMLEKLESEPEKSAYWRSELSDYGINWLRDHSREAGWSRQDLGALLQEEAKRARGLPPTFAGMQQYFRKSRVGSKYRLSRAARAAVFAQLVGRGVLK